jgi:carboxylesterase
MRKKRKRSKKKKKKMLLTIVSIIIGLYVLYFLYSNVGLERYDGEYIFYKGLKINSSNVVYNDEILKDAEPVFIERSKKKAVLMLHGLGGTPMSMKELAEYLADKNLTVFAPLLRSHGRTYEDFKDFNHTLGYKEVKNFTRILKKHYDKVYVVGHSTGGLFSLKLAEEGEVEGIVSLATTMTYGMDFLGDASYYFFSVTQYLTPSMSRISYGSAKDPEVRDSIPSFGRSPVKTLLQGEYLRKKVRDDLDKLTIPILVIQSTFDNRAAPVSAQYIYDNVGTEKENKELLYVNNSGHYLTLDYDKELVFKKTYEFIKNN